MLSCSKKGFWADGSDESRKQQRSAEDGDEEGNSRWRSSSSPGCQTYGCSGSDKNESARIYGSGSTSTSQRIALVSVIPEDVFVFKILPLLPLPQIFKLRCVCRSWYALLPRVLFGSKVDFADAKKAPWLVFASVIRSHYKPKDFTRELLAYIPASGRWFSFPLPFQSSPPSSSSSSEGWGSEARLHNSSTHYDISSLLGPGLQNTHPCYQKRATVSTHPLMASARGLVCTLVYNRNVFVDAQRLPLPSPRSYAFSRLFYLNGFGPFTDKASAFHWASLLLFNPLTGKALVEPLPPDPILSRVPLALSIVQAYEDGHHNSATSDRNCRYYVVLCPVPTVFGFIDARAGMWIYDLHRRSWKQNIATLGFRPYQTLGKFEFDVDRNFDTASIHSADGNQYDILRDADILTYEVRTHGADHVMPYISGMSWLFGYSIQQNLWMVAMVPEPIHSFPIRAQDFVVWKDGATCRIFLATCFRPCSEGLQSPADAIPLSGTPSTCTGFNVYELKHLPKHHVNFHANPQACYCWHLLSRTPSKMWRHFHDGPMSLKKAQHHDYEVMFCTAGSTVCMWSIDYRDTLAVSSPSLFRPIAYDVLLDTWTQLPPSPLPSSSARTTPYPRRLYGMLLPLFAFKPCLDETI